MYMTKIQAVMVVRFSNYPRLPKILHLLYTAIFSNALNYPFYCKFAGTKQEICEIKVIRNQRVQKFC